MAKPKKTLKIGPNDPKTWRVAVDPNYASMIDVMRKRIAEIVFEARHEAPEDEEEEEKAEIADLYFVRESGNSMWAVLRLRHTDTPLYLLHAIDHGGEGEIKTMAWEESLLPLMKLVVEKRATEFAHCKQCGHKKDERPIIGTDKTAGVCPGCGAADADPKILDQP